MLARVTRTLAAPALLAMALTGCSSVRGVGLHDLRGIALLDETPFTLYAEAPFRLVELPAGQDVPTFWSDFREAAAGDLDEMAISRVADARVLRVVFKDDGVTYAFHFGIYQERKADGVTVIRLVPISAWKPSFGGGTGVANVRADDAHFLIIPLKSRLTASASSVI